MRAPGATLRQNLDSGKVCGVFERSIPRNNPRFTYLSIVPEGSKPAVKLSIYAVNGRSERLDSPLALAFHSPGTYP